MSLKYCENLVTILKNSLEKNKMADLDKLYLIAGSALGASIPILYATWKFFQGGQFKKDHIKMNGKVVVITGSNTGIGKETALDLAGRGAKVYLACRDLNRAEAARLEIVEKSGNKNVFCRQLDLSSLESIRKFAKDFLKEETRLDVLVNNAGVLMSPKALTKDGFEMQLGTNHMGHFLLTNLLLDLIKKSAPSRIVVVSSILHTRGRLKKDDLNSEKSYNEIANYCQSKLANILFTRELSKKLAGTGVTINSLHPGTVNTEIKRHVHPFLLFLSAPFLALFFKTPKAGAQTQIRLAVDPELETVTGKYFSDCKVKAESKAAQNNEDALWLWKESEKWTDLEKSLKSLHD